MFISFMINLPFTHKTYKHYMGENKDNNLYTILGFQSTVKYRAPGSSYAWFTRSSNHMIEKRYVSFFILYNHLKCRIERFLINYGMPHTTTLNEPHSVKAKEINGIITNNLEINHDFINPIAVEVTDQQKVNNQLTGMFNNMKDGKLSNKSFGAFLGGSLIEYHREGQISYKSVYDMRLLLKARNVCESTYGNINLC